MCWKCHLKYKLKLNVLSGLIGLADLLHTLHFPGAWPLVRYVERENARVAADLRVDL
jgi:hypothetical protein